MGSKWILNLIFALILAGGATAGAYLWDDAYSIRGELSDALTLSRQMAAQAEGMAFSAREHGIEDPMSWMLGLLSQGNEPRIMRISKFQTSPSLQATESFNLDKKARVLDFTKVITPETGAGIHVQVNLGYRGFLRSRSRHLNDLLVGGFFILIFAVCLLFLQWLPAWRTQGTLRRFIQNWVADAKWIVADFGTQIRGLMEQLRALEKATASSKLAVGSLREEIHRGLTEMHACRQLFRNTDQLELRELRKVTQQVVHTVQDLERKLEPWATHADLAYQSFDLVDAVSGEFTSHVRKTTDTFLGQAKLMQSMSQRIKKKASVR